MIKLRNLLSIGLVACTTLLLSGCKMVILDPHGSIAAQEKHLMLTALGLMLIVVIPVILLTVIIAIRYRASANAKYTPDWAHNNWLELIWWFIPIVIIAILATITWETTHKLDPYRPLDVPGKPVTIEAVALRWKWLFIYPEQHIATINYIEFPAHTQVRFLITSDAPMNSFQIPALGGQIYAMNGMRTKLHLIADKEGLFHGRSVSFSGVGFSGMKFMAKATSEEAFQNWVQQVRNQAAHSLTMTSYQKLVTPSSYNKVQYFAPVSNGLFQNIIHTFMTPNLHNADKNFVRVSL